MILLMTIDFFRREMEGNQEDRNLEKNNGYLKKDS